MTYQKIVGALCANDSKGPCNQTVSQDKLIVEETTQIHPGGVLRRHLRLHITKVRACGTGGATERTEAIQLFTECAETDLQFRARKM